ncbi:response regulator [Gilvimarinus sp. F26214L]|uniref:response regulator n=1 Tax=Gilvimarinus sp. DZF01 TaxID=3461371 RepID=UPI00404653E7
MNRHSNQYRALLIAPTRDALACGRKRIEAHRQLGEFTLEGILETEAPRFLAEAVEVSKTPAVIFVDPGVRHLAPVTQMVQRLELPSHIMFIDGNENEELRSRLNHTPMARLHWSFAEVSDPDFGRRVKEAVEGADRRDQLRAVLDRANRQLRGYRTEDVRVQSRALSDYYLANFLAHAQDAVLATDAELRVRYWSAGAERLFGLQESETIGHPARSLPLWSGELAQTLRKIPEEADTLTVETQCSGSSGPMVVESVCSAVRDDGGRFIGVALIIRDVSERHRRLEAERAEQKRLTRIIDRERRHLRELFKQAPGFIAITAGPEHVFEVVNDAYLEVVGRHAILNKPAAQALPDLRDQEFLALLDSVFQSGEAHVGHAIPLTRSLEGGKRETRIVDFVFQPIIEEDGSVSGIFCQGNDVTEQKVAEQKLADNQEHLEELVEQRTRELQLSQEALHRSQKLEAVGQLTGGVAHDFNNVLQIISGNLQLIELQQQQGELDEHSVKHYLEAAVEAVERGSKLSSQLLAFARRQPLRPIPVNLGRVLRDMDSLLRRALGETIEIETVVAGGLWPTLVDPNQLENVVLNLAINARDAMPGGGKLTLELGNAVLDEDYVLLEPGVPAGQYVMLAISDTGHGMSADVLERAFDPFFTTKKEGKGTGLGLSMAYGFTRQSGGHIRIYSEPDHGTTFRIYLPRSAEKEVRPPPRPTGPTRGGSETVLVVEDDAAVRQTVVAMLEDLGYRVREADSGEAALEVIQSGECIDLLFTDVVMPGAVPSTELVKRAKVLCPSLAVVFTSGYAQNAIVHGGRLDPGVKLLSKPYRQEDLARKLRNVLDARESPPQPARSNHPASAGALRILLVEDDEDAREALAHLLTALGHQPLDAASAEAAIQRFPDGDFDLLLSDLNLTGRSGLELAEHFRRHKPNLPVIIASGESRVVHTLDPPVIELSKPFSLDGLRDALKEARAGYSQPG